MFIFSSIFATGPKGNGCVFISMFFIKQRESIFCAKNECRHKREMKGGICK